MARCAEKFWYVTRAAAEEALRETIRKTPDKRAAKRLNVYLCGCGKFHVGHRRNFKPAQATAAQPAPAPVVDGRKLPSWSELQRAAKRIGQRIDRDNLELAAKLGNVIEAEQALARAEQEVQQYIRQVADAALRGEI